MCSKRIGKFLFRSIVCHIQIGINNFVSNIQYTNTECFTILYFKNLLCIQKKKINSKKFI